MCSHDTVTWKVVSNTVADRMIDNSMIHKFVPSRRILRRTKILNAKIRKSGIKDYRQYVKVKTAVLRNLTDDTDTDDIGNLSDTDYNVIYNSKLTLAKYVAEDFKQDTFFTSKIEENYRTKRRRRSNIKSKKKFKECANIGWQEIVKTNRNMQDKARSMNDNIIRKHKYSDIVANKSSSQDNATIGETRSLNKNAKCSHRKLSVKMNESKSESDCQDNMISSRTRFVERNPIREDSNMIVNESSFSLTSQNPDYEVPLSRLIEFKNVKTPFSSNNSEESIVLEDHNTEKLIEANDENSINAKNRSDIRVANHKTLKLANVKRNLISLLDSVDSTNDKGNGGKDQSIEVRSDCGQLLPSSVNLSSDVSLDHQKDSGIDEDSHDKYVKRFDVKSPNNVTDIAAEISVSPRFKKTGKEAEEIRKDYTKCPNLRAYDILRKQNSTEAKKPMKNVFRQSNQSDNEDTEMPFAKPEDSCDIQKKYLQPKVTSTEIMNKRYKIVNERVSDVDIRGKCTTRINTLSNCSNVNDINNSQEEVMVNVTAKQEKPISTWSKETDNEEEEGDTSYMSPQTKKRLQQQARLNLIVDSDTSESEDENKYRVVVENSKSYVDSSDTNHYNGDDDEEESVKNNRKNCATEKSSTSISNSEDIREDICTHGKDRSKNDDSNCASEKSDDGFSSSDNENVYDKSNQRQDRGSVCELETRKPHLHLETSCRYRPCNLQELVEDQELLVETLPTSFTLADYSEDDEAFILNIPNKVLQYNLQGQRLVLKGKTIKFGKSKYRIVRKKVDTITYVFATGKRRKPYKMGNIKEVNIITVRERLPNPSRYADCAESESRPYPGTDTFSRTRGCLYNNNFEKSNRQTDDDKDTKSLGSR